MQFNWSGPLSLKLFNDFRYLVLGEDVSALTAPISLTSSIVRYTTGVLSGAVSIDDCRGKVIGFINSPAWPAPIESTYVATLAGVGSNGGLIVEITREGKLTIAGVLSNGFRFPYINAAQISGVWGTDVLHKSCRISVIRNSWNGVGACTNSYSYTPSIGWAAVGVMLSFLGNAMAEANYTIVIQDLLNPANNISFTTTLRLTP